MGAPAPLPVDAAGTTSALLPDKARTEIRSRRSNASTGPTSAIRTWPLRSLPANPSATLRRTVTRSSTEATRAARIGGVRATATTTAGSLAHLRQAGSLIRKPLGSLDSGTTGTPSVTAAARSHPDQARQALQKI